MSLFLKIEIREYSEEGWEKYKIHEQTVYAKVKSVVQHDGGLEVFIKKVKLNTDFEEGVQVVSLYSLKPVEDLGLTCITDDASDGWLYASCVKSFKLCTESDIVRDFDTLVAC